MKKTNLLSVFVLGLALQSHALASTEALDAVMDSAFDADFASEILPSDAGPGETLLSSTPEDLNRAKVVIVVNKSNIGSTAQTVKVHVDGQLVYTFKTSTGREKSEVTKSGRSTVTTTPIGYFRPYLLERNHWSNAWQANMEYTVFFNGGIALHATTKSHYAELGKRASGGCARLQLENAKTVFELVKSIGTKEVEQINRAGKTVLDKKGNPIKIKAYDVLVIVENRI